MLRYKTQTRPGLVALYNIRPGNGAGLFLQPQSLRAADTRQCNLVPVQAGKVTARYAPQTLMVLPPAGSQPLTGK